MGIFSRGPEVKVVEYKNRHKMQRGNKKLLKKGFKIDNVVAKPNNTLGNIFGIRSEHFVVTYIKE